MNPKDMADTLQFLRPGAEFSFKGTELEWLDKAQTQPTQAEIKSGWVAYQAAQKAQAQEKAQAKAILLERLGLTQEEFNTLIA